MRDDGGVSAVIRARLAGGFYAVVVVASLYGHVVAGGTDIGRAADLIAGSANLVVTALLFSLLRPVNALVALLAVLFNLEGIANTHVPLVFFGGFCLCTGYLIFRSGFLPRLLGVAMMLAGGGLLVSGYGPLVTALPRPVATIAFTLDGIGEIGLTLWLILFGVDEARWQQRAHEPR